MAVSVIDGKDAALLQAVKDAISGQTTITLDSEGVDLGRCGCTCVVQIGTRSSGCFLFDTLNHDSTSPMVQYLKGILEDRSITKIIHDCKMDSDAFYHAWGIVLSGVHDTQVCDTLLHCTGRGRNLNDTLRANGLQSNVCRDSSVYDKNVAFWATRPMTAQMIEWASGDVDSLFELYDVQIKSLDDSARTMLAKRMQDNADLLRTMMHKVLSHGSPCIFQHLSEFTTKKLQEIFIKCSTGAFIGFKGTGIHALLKKVPGTFMQFRGQKGDGKILLYGKSPKEIKKMENAIRRRESALLDRYE